MLDVNVNLAQADGASTVDSTNDQSITQSNECATSACLNGAAGNTFNDNEVVAAGFAIVTSDNTQSTEQSNSCLLGLPCSNEGANQNLISASGFAQVDSTDDQSNTQDNSCTFFVAVQHALTQME